MDDRIKLYYKYKQVYNPGLRRLKGYSGDLNTYHLNTKLFQARISNGLVCPMY